MYSLFSRYVFSTFEREKTVALDSNAAPSCFQESQYDFRARLAVLDSLDVQMLFTCRLIHLFGGQSGSENLSCWN